MDSFAQHTATSLGLDSTVLWIANSPVVFGYKNNHNIVHNPFTKKPELKNTLQDQYESKASQDDRLSDYHASVMKSLEDLEEKVQKHIIKNKVAQGSGQNGKKGW